MINKDVVRDDSQWVYADSPGASTGTCREKSIPPAADALGPSNTEALAALELSMGNQWYLAFHGEEFELFAPC